MWRQRKCFLRWTTRWRENKAVTEELIQICKSAMACIVEDSYTFLEDQQALSRVSSKDIRRVLKEYSPREQPVMPPDSYFEESAYMGEYRDGSGWYVDINLWYPDGESDLTLQLDIKKCGNQLAFIIDDLHVL
jgi:hypothetical protein